VPSDLSRYRDYLVSIFTGPFDEADAATRQETLETRLHQDLSTLDTTSKCANTIVIPILKAILTATDGHGFSRNPASIEPQGQRTPREYLDYLIGLTNQTADELRRRFRIDFSRADPIESNPVQENITALQGFYRDTFQSAKEPDSIIPDKLQGRAPFYLEYEEWLPYHGPFDPENHYLLTRTFDSRVSEDVREYAENHTKDSDGKWFVDVLAAEDHFHEGHEALRNSQYTKAWEKYETARTLASSALSDSLAWESKIPAYADAYELNWGESCYWRLPSGETAASMLEAELVKLGDMQVTNPTELEAYTKACLPVMPAPGPMGGQVVTNVFQDKWLCPMRHEIRAMLARFVRLVVPTCLGDVALAMGDHELAVQCYEKTTGFLMARANEEDHEGYRGSYPGEKLVISSGYNWGNLYEDGPLAYTTPIPAPADAVHVVTKFPQDYNRPVEENLQSFEKRYFKLRHVNALLDWADSLYRTDARDSIAHARELYKAALYLLGQTPAIEPTWPPKSKNKKGYKPSPNQIPVGGNGFDPADSVAWKFHANPAIVSQVSRAKLGFSQIEANLNFYGLNDSFVPILRYRPLKDTADRLAASAKSAQTDFLVFMSKLEDALKDRLVVNNMLQKATLQGYIAVEQRSVANYNVILAQQQVKAVEAQIEATKQQLEDKQSLGNQFKDYFTGMVGIATGMPAPMQAGAGSAMADGYAAGFAGAAGGATILGAYAAFIAFSYVTIKGMADAETSLRHQITALREEVLPIAHAGVEAREREVHIAELQAEIAKADADLAKALMDFEAHRVLNVEFWTNVTSIVKRLMRRYLELGARYGWLAERALAYEQDRTIDLIRLDYYPTKLSGVTGADLLQMDLAELEASRLDALKQTVPVKRTVSLAMEFPLEFAQLRKTGRCVFQTDEVPLLLGYPGTYGHRLRAVDVGFRTLEGSGPVRGILRNQGVSFLGAADGSRRVSLRPPSALPLSEFRLEKDRGVYEIPDETLMPFEGSGVHTFWELEVPTAGTPYGLDKVSDVELTFYGRASFAGATGALVSKQPLEVTRFVLLSAAKHAPKALEQLQANNGSVELAFPFGTVGLPGGESDRTIRNVAIMVVAKNQGNLNATIKATQPSTSIDGILEDGLVMSNAEPLDAPNTPTSPLNALVGLTADQTLTLFVKKAENPAYDLAGVQDVFFGVEYSAKI
jgi:hypothetical protein